MREEEREEEGVAPEEAELEAVAAGVGEAVGLNVGSA